MKRSVWPVIQDYSDRLQNPPLPGGHPPQRQSRQRQHTSGALARTRALGPLTPGFRETPTPVC